MNSRGMRNLKLLVTSDGLHPSSDGLQLNLKSSCNAFRVLRLLSAVGPDNRGASADVLPKETCTTPFV